MSKLLKTFFSISLCFMISYLLTYQAYAAVCSAGIKLGLGLPDTQTTSRLQSTIASTPASLLLGSQLYGIRYDRFILSTKKSCAPGSCFEVTNEDTATNRAFLKALGYNQYRWRVGWLANPSRRVFKTLPDLNSVRMPILLAEKTGPHAKVQRFKQAQCRMDLL